MVIRWLHDHRHRYKPGSGLRVSGNVTQRYSQDDVCGATTRDSCRGLRIPVSHRREEFKWC